MTRPFNVPNYYRSPEVAAIKSYRLRADPKRLDLSPTTLDFGPLQVLFARHFGFCFGVQNAIDIAYRAIEQNSDRRIFLLSEIIHNPLVNADLKRRGVRFLVGPDGRQIVEFSELTPEDIVIVPAFGTTVEVQSELKAYGIDPYRYDTTCPFVKKVWKTAESLGKAGYSVIVHGKRAHEETRATFSHSAQSAPTLIVRDMADVDILVDFLKTRIPVDTFLDFFAPATSPGFEPLRDLQRVGVVNQTTMLASETQQIAIRIRSTMVEIYGEAQINERYADTRDTLCYATNENQSSTEALIGAGADLALVVGGYNSSNTSHLVELCSVNLPTFYIQDEREILSREEIRSFDLKSASCRIVQNWLPDRSPIRIGLTSGASCPDKTVATVVNRLLELYPEAEPFDSVIRGVLKERSPR